ncbi:FAD-dependent oxidoreductase [Vagococcus luciliae]|uniref:NADH peroxidase n=1 Tax=Vagococcus luciliae TaxID=2920380 RepID=A0ABY5P1S5_9ENTE|nr:FAD-dependent oxidoreductase [Vagococcus luciliae]UUV99872.1 NADH peroxidase [Vagococcus luciliae]
MNVTIVGGSFAGVYCAIKVKELYPSFDVLLIEKKEKIGYIPSGLSMLLNGEIDTLDEAYFMTKEELEKSGIIVLTSTEVTSYDLSNKMIQTSNGIKLFDKLVLATGSSQKSSKMFDEFSDIKTYKDRESAEITLKSLTEVQEVVVIGAGQAGMELASGLIHHGKTVHVIETMDYPLYKYFDKDFLESFYTTTGKIEGLTFYFNETVKQIDDSILLFSSGNAIDIKEKLVLSANSVRPELSIFDNQLKSNSDNTIFVDDYLETSVKDVFAVGDLIQVPSFIFQTNVYAPLIVNAVQTSLTCAKNMIEKKEILRPMLKTIGVKLFDYYLASTGLMESEAFLYDERVKSVMMTLPISTIYKKDVTVKLVYNALTYHLLGVQLISKEPVLDKINTFALMIKEKIDIRTLNQLPHFYHAVFANTSLSFGDAFGKGDDLSEI